MGDFNIFSCVDLMFVVIILIGFEILKVFVKDEFGSNLVCDKCYDQILYLVCYLENFSNVGGVVDFYVSDYKLLFFDLIKFEFIFQMLDYLLLWIQINIDIDGFLFDQIIQCKSKQLLWCDCCRGDGLFLLLQ